MGHRRFADRDVQSERSNDLEPLAYLADVLTRMVNGHPNCRIDEILPWAYNRARQRPD
jgi:hypothetical protein